MWGPLSRFKMSTFRASKLPFLKYYMSNSSLLRLIIPAAVLAAALILMTADAGGDFSWIPMGGRDSEFDMDSESNRRMLATSNYISYGALQADTVMCSQSGASYYNCQPGAEANPYSRTCTAATQCRTA